jgi:hypothetical protein
VSFVSRNDDRRKFLLGVGRLVFIWAVPASTLAAKAATPKIALGQDHEPIFVVKIFALYERLFDGVSHDESLAGSKSESLGSADKNARRYTSTVRVSARVKL